MRSALILLPVLALSADATLRADTAPITTQPEREAPAANAEPTLLAAVPVEVGPEVEVAVNAEAQRALLLAAQVGDEVAAYEALRAGARLGRADAAGQTPLIRAALAGQTGMVEFLLARGASPDAQDHTGRTALMHACDARKLETVATLLKNGANPNLANVQGATALARVCASFQFLKETPGKPAASLDRELRRDTLISLLTTLLKHGANPNAGGGASMAPLVLAARYGEVDVVNMLLGSGADPEGRRVEASVPAAAGSAPFWETPLQAVLAAGNRARLEAAFLSDGGAISVGRREDLRRTAQARDLAIVKTLLEAGSGAREGMNRFALLDAAGGTPVAGTSVEMVKLLTVDRDSLTATDKDRRLALMEALNSGRVLLVMTPEAGQENSDRILPRPVAGPSAAGRLASGPVPASAPTRGRRGPLVPVALGTFTVPGGIVGGAAPAVVRHPSKSSAAMGTASRPWPVTWRYGAVARLVPPPQTAVEAPALLPPTSPQPLTALDERYGAPLGRTALIEAARAGQLEIVEFLLRQGAEPDARDAEGKTALMHVCGAGRTKWVRALPEKRAQALASAGPGDPRLVSRVVSYSEKKSWLDWAEQGDVAIVRALVKAGANLEAQDKLERTPLMFAARRSHPEVVRALVTLGASVNAVDYVGKTALMQVIGGGRYVAADTWMSPVLKTEYQLAMRAAQKERNYFVSLEAVRRQETLKLHQDLVKQETEREDSLIIHALVKAGSDMQMRDKQGKTAMDLAKEAKQAHAVRWMS